MSAFFCKNLKTITLPLALAAATVFSGCATTTSPEARLAYDKTQQNLKSQPVGIISDACVLRVEVGKDDIMYQHSDALSNTIASTLKSKLSNKGVNINNVSSPFVCGALTQKELAQMDIFLTEDSKEVLNTNYPVLSSSNDFDSITNQSYLNLYSALRNIKTTKDAKEGAYIDLGLDNNSLDVIRNKEKVSKVFVVIALANKQSMGLRLVAASTSPLIGGIINRAPGEYYGISLVNLDTNQIEWTKSGKIDNNVFKKPVTSVETKKMLDPLYPE